MDIDRVADIENDYSDSIFALGDCSRMEERLEHVPHNVTTDMSDFLTRDYDTEEIKVADRKSVV